MHLFDAILAVLLSLPPSAADARETANERAQRLEVLARAIDEASAEATCADDRDPECAPTWPGSQAELAALLISTGWHESAFARHVHAGACRAHECDNGRARSPWQLHASGMVPVAEWRAMAGSSADATYTAAVAAARVLASGRARCRSVSGALAAYATGGRCSWSGTRARLRTAQRVQPRLTGSP